MGGGGWGGEGVGREGKNKKTFKLSLCELDYREISSSKRLGEKDAHTLCLLTGKLKLKRTNTNKLY